METFENMPFCRGDGRRTWDEARQDSSIKSHAPLCGPGGRYSGSRRREGKVGAGAISICRAVGDAGQCDRGARSGLGALDHSAVIDVLLRRLQEPVWPSMRGHRPDFDRCPLAIGFPLPWRRDEVCIHDLP